MDEHNEITETYDVKTGIGFLSDYPAVCNVLNAVQLDMIFKNGSGRTVLGKSELRSSVGSLSADEFDKAISILTSIDVFEKNRNSSSYKVNRESEVLLRWMSLKPDFRDRILSNPILLGGIDFFLTLHPNSETTVSHLHSWLADEYTREDAVRCISLLNAEDIIRQEGSTQDSSNQRREQRYTVIETDKLYKLTALDVAVSRKLKT